MPTLFRIVKARFKFLVAAFLAGMLIGIPAARLMPLSYVASMTITSARYSSDTKPPTQTGVVSLLSTGADLGELSDFALYLQLLTSQQVAAALFRNSPNLVHELYPGQWKGDHWAPSEALRSRIGRVVFAILGSSAWEPPDSLDLARRLTSLVEIEKKAREPVAIVSVHTKDRALGIALLTALHRETETIMKYNARTRSEVKAQFLLKLMERTPGLGVADAIVQAGIRNQIAAAISRSPVPFAAEFIATPDSPMLPNRRPLLFVPLILGVLSTLVALGYFLFSYWRSANYPLPSSMAWLRN